MKEIGGYFELELPVSCNKFLHSEGVLVNSGRHALEYILRGLDDLKRLWMPDFTCPVVLQPVEKLGISYIKYEVDWNFEIKNLPGLKEGDYILVNNYFGMMDKYILEISAIYGEKLIIDNSQAWYAPEIPDTKCFYSPRKFFGVPDGGIAFTDKASTLELKKGISWNRCSHLLKRWDINASFGYNDFQENSNSFKDEDLSSMSSLTYALLSQINMEGVKIKRRLNFLKLHSNLNIHNNFNLPDINTFECPMVYPFYSSNKEIRKILLENKIYIAKYWPEVKCSKDKKNITINSDFILPIPCDQRYGLEEMNFISEIIKTSL